MKERYENINGIRAFTAIGIVVGHVKVIGQYSISGFAYDRFLASTINLSVFFMILSAFSMCCGYYEKIRNGTADLNSFYKRRYQRIWPFFALLCTLEMIFDHSLTSVYEWFADITLAFGLLPNHRINVVGAGWFIGLVFVFYMLFPFFAFLMHNKVRAWIAMGTSVILNILCEKYFFDSDHMLSGFFARSNLAYSAVFFVTGGLIYLYRNELKAIVQKYKPAAIIITLTALAVFYAFADFELMLVIVFGLLTVLGISFDGKISKILFQNKVIQIISSVSMEIYLCHMFVYRVLERIGLIHMTGNETVNHIIISAATLIGAVIMAFALNKIIEILNKRIKGLRGAEQGIH